MKKFEHIKVGTTVYDIRKGEGVVSCNKGVFESGLYPLQVKFSSGSMHKYMSDGRASVDDIYLSLFYKMPKIDYDEPIPEREINWGKVPVDTKVLAYNSPDNRYVRYFVAYLPSALRTFICFDHGRQRDSAKDCIGWERCEIHPDVEILEEWYE